MLDFLVLVAGAFLAVLALPNEVFPSGWPFLGPLVLVPIFWFTSRRRPWLSAGGGVIWGTLVTLLSQFWLVSFHPWAFPLVWLLTMPWYAAAFGVSSLLWARFPRAGLWLQALWWTAFEFLRIQGFLAYPYGALATSVWSWPVVFQSADMVGTSGITFLLAWTSAWGAAWAGGHLAWSQLRLHLVAGLGLWGLNLGYGILQLSRPPEGPLWRPALVQQAQDPWDESASSYEAGLDRLEALSTQALLGQPDVVVWSETAFVPSVEFHQRYRESPSRLRLVRRLEAFLSSHDVAFILGNDHREKTPAGTTVDYNAALAWDQGWAGRYEKNRLVPFTESFPYRDWLPWVYDWLLAADTHFWEPGRGQPVLTVGGVSVGTPICYEDAFPDAARAFSLAGAQALVNLTNDSWAPGKASRMQHLSLAVFRSVETRLPLVRAGNDGATAAVSSRGEVLALLPIGPPGVLQAEVRLDSSPPTFYTRTGDWFAISCFGAVLACLAAGFRQRSIVDKGPEL